MTVITGQSGVGKSTLLNALDISLNLETNQISKALGRGKHTTRHVELMNLYDGYVADTPGFSSLELEMEPIKREHIMILMNMLLIVSLEDVCMIVNLIVLLKRLLMKERFLKNVMNII